MDQDCGFDEDGRWFRYRAAAIILHDGSVLMARNDGEPHFYSIGGGVQHMETAEAAVRREARDETGLDLSIDRLAFVHENFFSG
ncbi:MAG TPA: NUDIX domain-containing protein [Propionicimonas sp.]|jgi:ADP-ribose pyrophosphatase YjhB (NUDIX family)